jgi:hypothetical protein
MALMTKATENKALNMNGQKIAKLKQQLPLREERLRDALKWQQLDPESPEQQAHVEAAASALERLKAEIEQEEQKAAAQAEFDRMEPSLHSDSVAFKTDAEQWAKAGIALFERGKKLGRQFRSTVITIENGYQQLRPGRFKSSGLCWALVFENDVLNDALKAFLRECEVQQPAKPVESVKATFVPNYARPKVRRS